MRMNLLNRWIWKIINKNAFKFIKSKNKILWTYNDIIIMSYIAKNLNDEQSKYIIKCKIIKKIWNIFTNILSESGRLSLRALGGKPSGCLHGQIVVAGCYASSCN